MDLNVTLNLKDCNAHFATSLLFNTVLICVFLCLGIIGNSLVLFLYKYRMPQTEERFFIPYLAVADLFSTVSLGYCDKLLFYRLSEWRFMQVSSILFLGNNFMVSLAFADDFPQQVSKKLSTNRETNDEI